MDVTMPDGTVIQGVPDGVTKSQLLAKYQKYSPSPSQPDNSFSSRMGNDLANRKLTAEKSLIANFQGEQGLPSTALQLAGGVGGSLLDLGSETAKSIIPDSVKNGFTSGAQSIANAIDSTGAGQSVGDALLQGKDKAQDLTKQYPVAARNIGAVANIEGGLPILSGLNDIRNGLASAAENAATSPERLAGNFPKAMAAPAKPIASDAIKSASQNAYKYSSDIGGVLNPDTFTNNALDIIDKAKAKPIAGKVLTSEQKALNSALDEYSPLRDTPLTISDFENLDKSLGAKESAAMDGFKSTANSRAIGQVQDAIRERLQKLQPDDVVGGKEGFEALTQHAIPLWSTQAKMSDLENIINRANMMDNPSQAMRTGFRNLYLNKGKLAQYPQEVQNLIEKAAQTGVADDLLGIVGSRLNPIIGAVNGPAGMVTKMATSGIGRGIRNSMKNNQANKILSAMTEPVRGSVEKFSTIPDLPPNYVKPEVPIPVADPYINPNAGQLSRFTPNSEISLSPKPEVPAARGETSDYFVPEYKKGGSVKKNLTAEFLARASRK